ncbi:NUDIX domain-containing protein [Mycolicibacterium smegmatis]|uniref:NUDIX hydrolase n=1 Tax=Mycolicibacterium smegmatis TaxID=1772 RepID=UPI0005D871C3|nr:NUDIX domain-containing protein [Mycolicibacterium smegmatis]MDF1903569.1 NUDIX domain-containing protein [Mycolicibacterium smegmatis]MDF1910095.1 NUDIX domain-containing protein [Mycolicibacterium smegmatis]MDF1921950.1 NUDIX domain-containing protein [Mycolicibacterium smegmatis]MDF1928460.1 NUDIX domain-containing protein [Mycolicibacterium smegmatis]UAK53492.1 NUDIX domain-containing protein [Mycolicibacterium smegmatis]
MDNKAYQDSGGRSLEKYPRPSVAVDAAVLTVDPETGLTVLQVRRAGGPGWALPGTFLHQGETLAEAVNRALSTKANVQGLRPRQLHVFDDPHRDNRGWVLSVAHVAVVPPDQLVDRFPQSTRLMPVHTPGRLIYDHADIIALAVADVRARYDSSPDPDHLLGDEFTLRDLRLIHEAVAGHALQRDTFRRAMEPHLISTGDTVSRGRGRPAELFRRRNDE